MIVSLRFAAGAESKGRARRGAVAFGEVANGNEVVIDLGLGGLDDPLSAGNLRGLSVTSCCKVAVFHQRTPGPCPLAAETPTPRHGVAAESGLQVDYESLEVVGDHQYLLGLTDL